MTKNTEIFDYRPSASDHCPAVQGYVFGNVRKHGK